MPEPALEDLLPTITHLKSWHLDVGRWCANTVYFGHTKTHWVVSTLSGAYRQFTSFDTGWQYVRGLVPNAGQPESEWRTLPQA